MLLAEKKMEEIEGKMKGWEHFQERAKLNAILCDFLQREIILGVAECSGDVRNSSKKNMTKHVTTKRILTFFTPYHARPSDAIGSSMEGHEKNMDEIGWKMKGWEQFQERTRYNAILKDFPKKDFQSCLMMFDVV